MISTKLDVERFDEKFRKFLETQNNIPIKNT